VFRPVTAQRGREPLWTKPLLLTNSTKQNKTKQNRQHKVTQFIDFGFKFNLFLLTQREREREWVMMKCEKTKGTVNWRIYVWILLNMMELSRFAFGFISSNQLHSLLPFFIRSLLFFLQFHLLLLFSVFIISLLFRIKVSLGLCFFFFVKPPNGDL